MKFKRRDFLKGTTLAAAACISSRLAAEGTTLVTPSMAKGLSRPDGLQVVEHNVELKPVAKYRAKASNGLIYMGNGNGQPSFLKCETTSQDGAVGAVLKWMSVKEQKGK